MKSFGFNIEDNCPHSIKRIGRFVAKICVTLVLTYFVSMHKIIDELNLWYLQNQLKFV